ncbi:MAG: hypothetical protein Q8P67_24980 [archaeon]|nr:hypothetical protein [archaeon]
MDETYDCIVLGTGLKECVLSGLLSVHKYKVLHMDRNNYYGGECASLNLQQLYEQYGGGKTVPAEFNNVRDWNIDLVPKLIMSAGLLVKMLIVTNTTKYLEFKQIDGSFVVAEDMKVHKVPATSGEAMSSGLMSLFEKNRARKFLDFVAQYDPANRKTHEGMDLEKVNMAAVYKHFGLQTGTCDFIGHALALHRDDAYLEQPARPTVDKIRLYFESLARYLKSPYIYPLYGLGELPQAFARLSAIYGGTYMLDRKFEGIEYGPDGKFVGVKADGQLVKARFVVGDPSYFPDKVKKVGQVVRCINILKGTINNTKEADSAQVIVPQKPTKRRNDTYISMVSHNHQVAGLGFRVATVSTTVETANPAEELKFAVSLLPPVLDNFIIVKDIFEATSDGIAEQVFISKSYDATSHFETASLDILDIWKRISGTDLDLTKSPVAPEEDGGPSSSGQ